MREIFDGVFHWTAFQEPIGMDVSCYYVASAGVVIDPKVPPGGFAELPGRPEQILLTSGHHNRDAAEFAQEFGIPIRVSREAADYLGGKLEVEAFAEGEEVAPGITAIHTGALSEDEGAFHIGAGSGAIAFADGLICYGGVIRFVPDNLIGDDPEGVKAGLKSAFRKLLSREFDNLLVAHGDPVVGGGKAALQRFAETEADEVPVQAAASATRDRRD